MKTEKVFEILAEGGGFCINRQKNKSGEKFLFQHNEFDPTDEGLDINKKVEYQSFEKPFQLINNKYPWYMLHIETVHDDFKNYVINEMIEKLNEESIAPDYLEYSKFQLENIFKIKLNCKMNKNNEPIWSFSRLVK